MKISLKNKIIPEALAIAKAAMQIVLCCDKWGRELHLASGVN
jgi:hypothetical protein